MSGQRQGGQCAGQNWGQGRAAKRAAAGGRGRGEIAAGHWGSGTQTGRQSGGVNLVGGWQLVANWPGWGRCCWEAAAAARHVRLQQSQKGSRSWRASSGSRKDRRRREGSETSSRPGTCGCREESSGRWMPCIAAGQPPVQRGQCRRRARHAGASPILSCWAGTPATSGPPGCARPRRGPRCAGSAGRPPGSAGTPAGLQHSADANGEGPLLWGRTQQRPAACSAAAAAALKQAPGAPEACRRSTASAGPSGSTPTRRPWQETSGWARQASAARCGSAEGSAGPQQQVEHGPEWAWLVCGMPAASCACRLHSQPAAAGGRQWHLRPTHPGSRRRRRSPARHGSTRRGS